MITSNRSAGPSEATVKAFVDPLTQSIPAHGGRPSGAALALVNGLPPAEDVPCRKPSWRRVPRCQALPTRPAFPGLAGAASSDTSVPVLRKGAGTVPLGGSRGFAGPRLLGPSPPAWISARQSGDGVAANLLTGIRRQAAVSPRRLFFIIHEVLAPGHLRSFHSFCSPAGGSTINTALHAATRLNPQGRLTSSKNHGE